MIKVKLGLLSQSVEALNALVILELPLDICYRLKKIVKLVNEEVMPYEEARQKKVKEYGEEVTVTDKDGHEIKSIQVKPENFEKFSEEFNPLANKEVEINCDKIKKTELGDLKKLTYKVFYLTILEQWLLEE